MNDPVLTKDYEDFFTLPELGLIPIDKAILREAAHLRATIPKLKPPDAIHAATAFSERCVLFITNDTDFRAVPGLPVIILDDLLAVP